MPQTQILGWAAPGIPNPYGKGSTGLIDYGVSPAGSIPSVGTYGGTLGAALVPNVMGLETQSSKDIGELLNPPSVFPDTSRQAAELAGARGIPGSSAAYGTGLRMTDEERLKRIALGENLLSAAYARTLPYAITGEQNIQNKLAQDRLALDQQRLAWEKQYQQQQLDRLNTPTIRYGGGLPQSPSGGGTPMIPGGEPMLPPSYYGSVGAGLDYGNVQVGGYQPTTTSTGGGFDFYNPPAPNYGLTGGKIGRAHV